MWWRKAMHMLGLEDDGEYHEQDMPPGRDRPGGDASSPAPPRHSSVTPRTQSGQIAAMEETSAVTVRPQRPGGPVDGPDGETRPVVRPVAVAPNARPQIVRPDSFDQAQVVADAYKTSQPVVMDLQRADRDLARRLIDFASGLCYGLGGQMERLDTQVYLLTPTSVSVSDAERTRLRETGYDT